MTEELIVRSTSSPVGEVRRGAIKKQCHSESLENKDFVRNFQAVQNLSNLECLLNILKRKTVVIIVNGEKA